MLLPGLTIWTSPVMANPSGGVVVHGDVKIGPANGGNLQIRQNSRNAIINWDTFSIDAGELTQFRQTMGPNSAVLNRVTGGDPSAIHGALRGNGNVFVINPNGILVGPGGTIDVHGVVLSTLDISNGEFLAGGDMNFKGVGKDVTNLGRINAVGGDVFLIGKTVSNSGSIRSESGTVGLAAGEEVLLTAEEGASGERIFVRATGSGVSGTGVYNDGTIEGAAVELKAHGNMYALAINNKGSVRATGASTSGGRVYLRGAGGTVSNSGSIRATSSGSGSGGRVLIDAAYAKVDGMIRAQGGNVRIAGGARTEIGGQIDVASAVGRGGEVVVEGDEIAVGSTAAVDASGVSGGGNVRIGGGFQGRDATVRNADTLTVAPGSVIRADATGSGRGGNVILWADNDTLFEGDVSAHGVSRGGFAEISGKVNLNFQGTADLTADNGPAGTLLLDPTDATISSAVASVSNVNNVSLSALLDGGNNVIISTNYGGAGPAGNITVNDRVEWYRENGGTTPGTLTLLAMGNVTFNQSVRSAGTGGVNVVAGWDGITGIIDPINGAGPETNPGAFDMAAIFATLPGGVNEALPDAAGLSDRSVFVNTAGGAVNVEVGSRFGATQIAAHDLVLTGGVNGVDRWAQVGFHDTGYEWELARTYHTSQRNEWWGNTAGNVRAKNYITDLGGTVVAGGAFEGAGYGANGAIAIRLSGRLDMRGASNQGRGYVQIGHGGNVDGEAVRGTTAPLPAVNTTRDGFVIDPADDNSRPYFGATWRTNYLGYAARIDAPISVIAEDDILVSAVRGFETVPGFTDFVIADQGAATYAMIGHGGYRQAASLHGNIFVEARGATGAADGRGLAGSGIQLRGSNGNGGFAQIGHGSGGGFNRRSIWDQQRSGAVSVTATAGAIRALGFNQLPRNAANLLQRNIGPVLGVDVPLEVNAAADLDSLYNHVQIGHGGSGESAPTTGGGFTAPNIGAVPNLYDPFNATFANPGTLISTRTPEMSMSGAVSVFAGGTVQVRDNMGYDAAGNWTPDPGPGLEPYLRTGGIMRTVGIEMRAGNGHSAYGMIGHGGTNLSALDALSTGHTGDISVISDLGDLLFVGGEEKRSQRPWGFGRNFVQIGHGGQSAQGLKQGAITVSAGQGGGALSGDIIFRTGRMTLSHAQIGHGGESVTRAITGDGLSDINVTAKGNVEFTSRASAPSNAMLSQDYVDIYQAETGSSAAGNAEWAERVVGTLASGTQIPQTNSVQVNRWDTNQKHAMIGHGGNNVNQNGVLSLNNAINVTAQEGSVRFTAGDNDRDFALIGMGGYRSGGTVSITGADIDVDAADDIILDASNPGGNMVERTTMLAIPIRNGSGQIIGLGQMNDVGRGFAHFAMIGNGGYDMDGDHSGTITVDAGRDLLAMGPKGGTITGVTGYRGGVIEGPSNNPASGIQNYWIGNAHAMTALQEATMMSRSFQLYHGNSGVSEPEHRGNIVAGTVSIDIGGTGGTDLFDFDNGNGTGTLKRGADRTSAGATSVVFGTINYTTGLVTINTSAVAANNGNLEDGTGNFQRNIDYQYSHPTLGVVTIGDERTPESDMAIRPNEAYAGHGRVLPGTFSIVVETAGGNLVYQDFLANGEIRDSSHQVVGNIDYGTGRLTFRRAINPTGDSVFSNYQYSSENSDASFVQIGNGGYASGTGGRNSAGHTGEIQVTAAGDIRFHGGAAFGSYAQIGHGGYDAASRHGAQTDGADLTVDRSGNITVSAGGIVEFLAGRGIHINEQRQYAMLGHGGYNTDGHHQGILSVTAGTGAMSLAPGVVGGGASAGVVFTSGVTLDAFSQMGHGGADAQSAREDGDTGRRGFTGSITVNTPGDIRFTAGTGAFSTNAVLGATTDWNDIRAYTQLGHGGIGSYTRNDSNTTTLYTSEIGHNGNITVNSTGGSVLFQGGDTAFGSPGAGFGILHYALLGHGGYDANGEHFGDISVTANQNISFRGGGILLDENVNKYSFAQLGHGGSFSDGDMGVRDTGGGQINTLTVTATTGDISFSGGSGQRNYAQLGFGGAGARGDHRANYVVTAGGNVHFVGGNAGVLNLVGDASSELDFATSQLGWVATRFRNLSTSDVRVTTDYGTFTANTGNGVLTVATLTGPGTLAGLTVGQAVGQVNYITGHVRFTTAVSGGTIPVQLNSAGGTVEDNDLVSPTTLLNSRNLQIDAAAQNPGTFSSPHLLATYNNTRSGLTGVTEAVGQRDQNVGIQAGTFSMTIPGVGGPDSLITDDGSGNLIVTTVGGGSGLSAGSQVGSIDYLDGSVRFTSVLNPLGMAGVRANYTLDRIVASDLSYAHLGSGGYDADNGTAFTLGNEGTIQVTAGGDVRFHGGNGQAAYTLLGHGGYATQGGNSGGITVNAPGIVEFLAGRGADLTDGGDFAQLGHGGYDADGNHSGAIVVNAGSGVVSMQPGGFGGGATSVGLNFKGGRTDQAYVQLGHGGYGARSGNGNGAANAVGITGNISVIADGSVVFTAGSLRKEIPANNDGIAYALLGHGGFDADTTADGVGVSTGVTSNTVGHNGSILVRSLSGGVAFSASSLAAGSEGDGFGRFQFAQIGHGGYASNGNHFGNITVEALDDITFTGGIDGSANAGSTTGGDIASYAQIGHGGRGVEGNLGARDGGGNPTNTTRVVSGGDILFQGGVGQENYAQLGNGGRLSRGDHAANLQVYAEGNVSFMASQADHLTGVGTFGRNSYLSSTAVGSMNLSDATDATFASATLWNQKIVPGTLRLEVVSLPTALGTLFTDVRDTPTSTTGKLFAQDGTTVVGTINYVTGAISFTQKLHNGTGASNNIAASYQHSDSGLAYALLGNGGHDADNGGAGSVGHVGEIAVGARTGNVLVQAGNDDQTFAQIGNGGYFTDGSGRGNIIVRAAGDVSVLGGTGNTVNTAKYAYAQIGHGGHQAGGTTGHSGSIVVSSGTGALFSNLGTGVFNDVFDLDGNGSKEAVTFGADVSVNGVRLLGGSGLEVAGSEIINDDPYAMIGHGGRSSGGNHNGVIAVSSSRDVSLIGGTAYRSFVQIGHGGLGSSGNLSGAISVISEAANGQVTVRAGAPVSGVNTFEAYALIGHGDDRHLNTDIAGGSRQGRIYVLGDHITVDRSDTDLAWIGHTFDMNEDIADPFSTQTLAVPASNLGGGYQVVGRNGLSYMNNGSMTSGGGASGAGTILLNDSFRDRYITPNLKDGDFTFTGGNLVIDTVLNSATSYANVAARASHLTFLAGGDIDQNYEIQNPGTGDVNLIAGVDIAPESIVDRPSLGGADYPQIDHLQLTPIGTFNMRAIRDDRAQFGQEVFGTGGFGPFAISSGEFSNAAGEISVDATAGAVAIGSRNGSTNLMGHGIRLFAGDGANESAQIGFRYNASFVNTTGMILVRALEGGVHLRAGTGASNGAFVQIGHGGTNAVGDQTGDICVQSDGSITFNDIAPGSGTGSYAQIGNGGLNADGNHLGFITVAAGHTATGDILMNAGGAADQYVQIGHGGHNADGNFGDTVASGSRGRISVIANNGGDLSITGGGGDGAYGMIGHGDGRGTYGSFGSGSSTGNRQGGIQTFVDGDLTLNVGSASNTNVHMIHRTSTGGGLTFPGTYLGGDGYVHVANGTTTGSGATGAFENQSVMAGGSFGLGNILITSAGDLTLTVPQFGDARDNEFVNHDFAFVVLAQGNLNFQRSFQNQGRGMVALVAGWDGNFDGGSVDFVDGLCNPHITPGAIDFDNCSRFGQGNKVLTIGSASQTSPVAVGSREGPTYLRGYAINLVGSNSTTGASTHVGFRADGSGDISGTIDVRAKQGGLTLASGSAMGAFTQIGHGHGSGAFNNNITSTATISVTFCDPGIIALNAGGTDAYAQIGHGGKGGNYTRNGNVTVSNFGGLNLNGGGSSGAYAQIGHGGIGSTGALGGSLELSSSTTGAAASISLLGGGGNDAFAKIGHGGASAIGAVTDSGISVDTTGSITLTGGGSSANAQIGHGGYNAFNLTVSDSDISINAAPGSGTGDIVLTGGTGDNAGAMIGHGGNRTNGNVGLGDTSANGDITIANAANIRLIGGAGGASDSHAQIGHGGERGAGVWSGDIQVNSAGEIALRGNTGANRYAMIGHGGNIAGTAALGAMSGDITLTAGGNVSLNGGTGSQGFAQVGHGGYQGRGTKTGEITVTSTGGTLDVIAGGSGFDTYAQIGHGGRSAIGTASGAVQVAIDGSVNVTGGLGASGTERYAQIGHGGVSSTGDRSGDLLLTSGGNITLLGGGSQASSVQIGHGGYQNSGNHSDNVTVTANGSISGTGGSGTRSSVHVGHGGASANSPAGYVGNVAVNALNGSVSFAGGGGTDSQARVGHGGAGSSGDHNGWVSVSGLTGVSVTGGGGTRALAQIGHGGGAVSGNLSGDVFVNRDPLTQAPTGGGLVRVRGGGGGEAYAQIGLGAATSGTFTSSTLVYGSSVEVKVGIGDTAYSRIGAGGGVNLTAAINGSTAVEAVGGGVTLDASGGGGNAYAQIGMGGLGGSGAIAGSTAFSTSVVATGPVALLAGSANNASAMIGAGGAGRDGARTNAGVQVVGSSVSVTGSTGNSAFAQIGSGGGLTSSSNSVTADVAGPVSVVSTTGNVTVTGGGSRGYAQIGHGGLDFSGAATGELQVVSAGDLLLNGGTNAGAYALVGHGGRIEAGGLTTGVREGNVLIRAQGLTSLTDNTSAAFIGHRGAAGVTSLGESSRLALVTGQLSTIGSADHLTGMIANVIQAGTVEIGVTNGDLDVAGAALTYNSANHLDLFAAGDTTFSVSVQNSGSGAITGVAGWDGTTGLIESITPLAAPPITSLSLDAAVVEASPTAYDNNGGILAVGDSAQVSATNVGSREGRTAMLGDSVRVVAGDGAANLYSQIGYRGTSAAAITGAIHVASGSGGILVDGATQNGGFAQIGHGGFGAVAAPVNATITLMGEDLSLNGGDGSNAYAQVGHGGSAYTQSLAGEITALGTLGDVALSSGSGLAAYSQIGHGGDSSTGAKSGNLAITADSFALQGNGARAVAQIGHGGRAGGGALSGAITLASTLGGVSLTAGTGASSSAVIGMGGQAYSGLATASPISITSFADVLLQSSTGLQSSAMIGNGGDGAVGSGYGGDISVTASGNVSLLSGSAGFAFTQIGHGGNLSSGAKSGGISVVSGGDVLVQAPNSVAALAYAQIGHGDDLRIVGGGGSGTRSGDVVVSAASDLTVTQGLIGHKNSFTTAPASGETWIASSRTDPSNPAGGTLLVDSLGELSGVDGIRVYVPRRQNNQIAVGAKLNGVSYTGAKTDPSTSQGADEFAKFVQYPSGTVQVDEHDNSLGSGPTPTVAGNFAFYYDTILLTNPPAPPTSPAVPLPPQPPGYPIPDYRDLVPDDRYLDDWLEDEEVIFTMPGSTLIYYEGFSQYGPFGESIFDFNHTIGTSGGDEEEDVLRRHLEKLRLQQEQAGQSSGSANESSEGAE